MYIVILVIELLSHPVILESDCKIHSPFLCEMVFFVINIQQNLRLLNFRKHGCVLTEFFITKVLFSEAISSYKSSQKFNNF